MEKYRELIVGHIAKREINERAFIKWVAYFDEFCGDYYIERKQ
jgi:hypothetical protein